MEIISYLKSTICILPVPKQVLKDRYESLSEPDEPEDFEGDVNDLYDDDQFYKESEAIPKLQSNVTTGVNGSQSNTTTVSSASAFVNVSGTTEPITTTGNPVISHTQGMNLNGKLLTIILLFDTQKYNLVNNELQLHTHRRTP